MAVDLVTGGAGFIGSHLTERLLSEGRDVRVIDDFSSGKKGNLEFNVDSQRWGRLDVMPGTITDVDLIRKALDGVENVYHQAAIPSVPRSVANPVATNNVNVTGTMALLAAARDAGVKRFIYASSSSVYGDSPTLPKVETMPCSPLSPYAISKMAGESYARAFFRLYGLPTIGLRYFNIFGPRQDPTSEYAAVVPRFITAMERGKRPTIYGDGTQTRDFTYIQNAVEANLLAARCGEPAFGETFNIACGQRISLLELVEHLNGILGCALEPEHAPERAGDVKHSLADIAAASEKLGFTPRIALKEGLTRTAAWFRKKH